MVLGLWLISGAFALGLTRPLQMSEIISGSLVIVLAVLSLAGRPFWKFWAPWVILAPWILSGATSASKSSDMVVAAMVIVLSLPRGSIAERYGAWQPRVR